MKKDETNCLLDTAVPVAENNRRLLFRSLAALENEDEAMLFFEELCTPKEITFMAQRLAVAELLVQGYTYGSILRQLKHEGSTISTATISRVNDMVRNGSGSIEIMLRCVNGIAGC